MTGARHARAFAGALALAGLVALVYGQVGGFGFVAYDDGLYVTENPMVQRGLTWDGLVWAFTTLHATNWHPLTWLSLMGDVSLFGVDPGWMHRVNVLWHLANALLLWRVLERYTGARWRSWLVATHFAVLPVHVESVAWISERKDVLSTFFWLLTLAAWLGWLRRRSAWRYALALAAFALGLLAKPMLVTLPIVLLLLDVWPLGRLGPGPDRAARVRRAVLEKLPLLALSLASGVTTIVAQHAGGATATREALPLAARAGNAALSAALYLWKTAWPAKLAVFYPNPAVGPAGLPPGPVVAAVLLLAAISVVAAWQRHRRPWLLVGWLWFLITLLPVIGLLQVGLQGMADRYTYVPVIGVSLALAWLLPGRWGATRAGRLALGVAAAALLLGLAGAARAQAAVWRDSFTLFSHATRVTEGNWLAWKNLGTIHHGRGDTVRALEAFREAARARPDDPDVWFDLGTEHAALDQHAQAAECFRRAVLLEPSDREAWFRLAVARALLGERDAAAEAVRRLGALDAVLGAQAAQVVDRIERQLAGSR